MIVSLAACGPATRKETTDGGPDVDAYDPSVCTDGATEPCYDGKVGTEGVGPCHVGMRSCVGGQWTSCTGEVVPSLDLCGDGIDQNCNGRTDEDEDLDGDGYTTCQHDCCDSPGDCSDPTLVNPGAFEAAGNMVDDDCDGIVDNAIAHCDDVGVAGIHPDTTDAMDFARAIDLCQTTTMTDPKWGVIEATLTLASGTGTPAAVSHAVRPHFGTGTTTPRIGNGLAVLSTGHAAAPADSSPAFQDWEGGPQNGNNTSSAFPADWYAANGSTLPNAPGCPPPTGTTANDPVMLTLKIRAPSNAKSFKLQTNFFSSEFPEYTCSPYNDFFVILLDSAYTGTPANPADKNLAFYKGASGAIYPVGVNLAAGNTGLFRQCTNGAISCSDLFSTASISTCTGTSDLTGTGMDPLATFGCDANSQVGGATGWLETSGNVVGGEIITLRIAVWDTSDHVLDSAAILDAFEWSVDSATPGTIISRQR
ncbi:MAG: choice-of-anchor L domain-containing protein [Proteobacteria bacterium]|nr:choice-of-anchor L domain-containing protein [Pseudomonadota bacterium]